MRVELFDFDLPEELIALRPAVPRDAARLLEVLPDGGLRDGEIINLPSRLREGDLLVFNDTRVLPVQLRGERRRPHGSVGIDVTLLERCGERTWKAFARPGRRLAAGDLIRFPEAEAKVVDKRPDGSVILEFDKAGGAFDVMLARTGRMPLPPYIASRRPADDRDREDYQTIFARQPGSVAAPTAGLHFTDRLMAALRDAGVETALVTLHVGPGTFLPVKVEDTDAHVMHGERGVVGEDTVAKVEAARKAGGRIVAVGTTSLRLLEAAAVAPGELAPFDGVTDIFITPGYRFRAIDGLVTNFHLPRSTLFMLVSALAGIETMKRAYGHAIAKRYRFYSYGDACLVWRASKA